MVFLFKRELCKHFKEQYFMVSTLSCSFYVISPKKVRRYQKAVEMNEIDNGVLMSFVFMIMPTERLLWPAIQWLYRHACMTNPQELTANQNWLYQIGYRIGYRSIQSLMHIPRFNISLTYYMGREVLLL